MNAHLAKGCDHQIGGKYIAKFDTFKVSFNPIHLLFCNYHRCDIKWKIFCLESTDACYLYVYTS